MPQVLPIQRDDLPAVGEFLNRHLASRITPAAWVASLGHAWAQVRPNFGMQLRDDGRLVGALLAVYSDQVVDGRVERFCNPHSWCVLDAYRGSGLGLVLQLLRQRDYHFTMFTPNPQVTKVFLGLRFRLLDDRLLFVANLPAAAAWRSRTFVEADPARIAERLRGSALDEFEAHRSIPWLKFVAFGTRDDACLAIYKRTRWKKMACASIMSLSDPAALDRHRGLLGAHLLMRGMPVACIERRMVREEPRFSVHSRRRQAKLVSSPTLRDDQVRDVYSELMALDL